MPRIQIELSISQQLLYVTAKLLYSNSKSIMYSKQKPLSYHTKVLIFYIKYIHVQCNVCSKNMHVSIKPKAQMCRNKHKPCAPSLGACSNNHRECLKSQTPPSYNENQQPFLHIRSYAKAYKALSSCAHKQPFHVCWE